MDNRFISYEEAFQNEQSKKIVKENQELDKRIKLESALTILVYIIIILILVTILFKGITLLGIINLTT